VPIKVGAPPASDPLPASPNIFTPKPVFRQNPVALKATGNTTGGKADAVKPKASKLELPPTLPVAGQASARSPAVPFTSPRRYSLRRRVAIVLGLVVAVAVTTWGAVRVMAAGHRDGPSVKAADSSAR
jgi:hypothetical protein